MSQCRTSKVENRAAGDRNFTKLAEIGVSGEIAHFNSVSAHALAAIAFAPAKTPRDILSKNTAFAAGVRRRPLFPVVYHTDVHSPTAFPDMRQIVNV
jgi:hypothetical protein